MNLFQISNLDLSKLPENALFAIKDAISAEIKRRGAYRFARDSRIHSIAKNRYKSAKSPDRQKYLPLLLNEDWSSFYPLDHLCQERKYYVYAHLDPSAGGMKIEDFSLNGLPFYIGKGTGDRAYDLKRNEGHGAVPRLMREMGVDAKDIVQIIRDDMTEQEALCLEAKLIHFFGTRFDGIKNGILVNLSKPKTPYD